MLENRTNSFIQRTQSKFFNASLLFIIFIIEINMSALIKHYNDYLCSALVCGYARAETYTIIIDRDVCSICIDYIFIPCSFGFCNGIEMDKIHYMLLFRQMCPKLYVELLNLSGSRRWSDLCHQSIDRYPFHHLSVKNITDETLLKPLMIGTQWLSRKNYRSTDHRINYIRYLKVTIQLCKKWMSIKYNKGIKQLIEMYEYHYFRTYVVNPSRKYVAAHLDYYLNHFWVNHSTDFTNRIKIDFKSKDNWANINRMKMCILLQQFVDRNATLELNSVLDVVRLQYEIAARRLPYAVKQINRVTSDASSVIAETFFL
eukprot:1102914_1